MLILELAENLGLSEKELRQVIKDLNLPVSPNAKDISDDHTREINEYLGEEVLSEETITDESNENESVNNTNDDLGADNFGSIEEERIMRKREDEEVKSIKMARVKKETKQEAQERLRRQEEERLRKEREKEDEMSLTRSKITNLVIPEAISIKELAEKLVVPSSKLISLLLKNNIFVTINHKIDFETASILASEFGKEVIKEETKISSTDLMEGNLEALLKQDEESSFNELRAPIVTIMGHVDHGKTSLLDYIRKTQIASREAGGITQHIGAYQTDVDGKIITFLDTPGHEAFAAMRARGARVTDIAVLVVAADDGVKPQTEEAIAHIKEAGVKLIVAINKIDKPGANLDRVKGDLAKFDVQSEDWGGNIPMVAVSALTGQGVQELIDTIILISDELNLKADPTRFAVGTVIESVLDPNLGPTATIIINTGTLKTGDVFVVGETYGKVKNMKDFLGKNVQIAGPSRPVRLSGINEVPIVGDILQVFEDEKESRKKALEVKALRQSEKYRLGSGMDLVTMMNKIKSGELKTLKIVLKVDTKGSLEAIRGVIDKIKNDTVSVKIIHSGVGAIAPTDVLMASSSGAIVIGFSVGNNSPQVEDMARRENVEIRHYNIIYKIAEDLENILIGLLDPEIIEHDLGNSRVLALFYSKGNDKVIGLKVDKGKIENKAKFRILRAGNVIGEGEVTSLQKNKESVQEVKEGYECGIKAKTNITIEEDDILNFYKIEKKKRTSL